MAKYTVTPWRSQSDLLEVRQQLYSKPEQNELRRHAVDRIMAWKQRGSNLPHAVESTALLIDAILHHHASTPASSTPSEATGNSLFSIRAVYSAAFTRFVTGFCDIGRAKERQLEPSSMLVIARQIGMPSEFVALRHEATHEELPGIQRLVGATEQALDWLWRVYWGRLDEGEMGGERAVEVVTAVKDEARSVLRGFRSARRAALKAGKQGSQAHREEMGNALGVCARLCSGGKRRLEAFTEVLVEERLLIPSSRVLGASMEGAFIIWDDLLTELQARQSAFLATLVQKMLIAISKASDEEPEGDVDKEALCLWLLRFLDVELSPGRGHALSRLQSTAMQWYCLHPGYWTQRLGEEMLESGDEEFKEEWQILFDASKLSAQSAESGDTAMVVDHPNDDVSDDESECQRWVRSVVAARTPIGVV